jgi:hypothetical protein
MQVLNADGSRVQLTPEGSHDIAPSWSPDGSRIAFLSRHPDDGDEIYVMNADGSGRVRLTGGRSTAPGASHALSCPVQGVSGPASRACKIAPVGERTVNKRRTPGPSASLSP